MVYRGWLTSHENFFHLHSLYGIRLPFFAWPTFAASLFVLGVPYLVSLYKMVAAARARRFEEHRKWAVLHTISGYTIAIERLISAGINGIARVMHILPDWIKIDWLDFPTTTSKIIDAEVAALAWTVAAALAIVGVWAYQEGCLTNISTAVKKSKDMR